MLDNYSINDKLSFKVLKKTFGQLSLDISNVNSFLLFYEISNTLLALLLEKLLKSVWTEVVKEFLDIFLLLLFIFDILASTNMEINANIKWDHDVIFCWDLLDRALESDGVLGNHHGDGSEISTMAEATLKTRFDNSSSFTEMLAKSVHAIWNEHVRGEWAPKATDTASIIIDKA